VKPAVNKAIAVGALVALAGVAFLFAFTFFRKGGYSTRDSYLVRARFTDATGLTWKSRVQIAGIQVGEVTEISLDDSRALLEIRIRNDVPLYKDACLYKSFPSALLPDAILEVAPGSREQLSMRDLPEAEREITCIREATSVQQLLDAMARIAQDVQLLTGDLAKTVNGERGSLRTIVENVAAITDRVDRLVAENDANITEILQNTRDFTGDLRDIASRDKERIHAILVNTERLTAQLRETAATLQGIMTGEPTSGTGSPPGADMAGPEGIEGGPVIAAAPVTPGAPGTPGPAGVPGTPGAAGAPAPSAPQAKGVQQAVARLNDSLAKLDDILGRVREGKSVAGKLLVDERMGRKVGSAVEGITDYVDRLQELQIELSLRSEFLFNQSVDDGRPGAKVYFGARILPRPDKFYLVEVVSDPRGVDTVTTDTVTTRNAATGAESTSITTRVEHEDKLTFSVQLGKRFGPVTFRAGVIESSGGLGADLHLLEDALQLSVNFYQFSRPGDQDALPRAKVWANYNFLSHFYVTTGVDDFLNRWRTGNLPGGRSFSLGTDVFFGAGVYFTDDDIKTLLLSGSGNAASAAR
jgi:phospholipid/cholesterol/gamma-HCH transport system substrate-binding protein